MQGNCRDKVELLVVKRPFAGEGRGGTDGGQIPIGPGVRGEGRGVLGRPRRRSMVQNVGVDALLRTFQAARMFKYEKTFKVLMGKNGG